MPTGSLCLSIDSRVSLATGVTMRLAEFASLLPQHGLPPLGARSVPRVLSLDDAPADSDMLMVLGDSSSSSSAAATPPAAAVVSSSVQLSTDRLFVTPISAAGVETLHGLDATLAALKNGAATEVINQVLVPTASTHSTIKVDDEHDADSDPESDSETETEIEEKNDAMDLAEQLAEGVHSSDLRPLVAPLPGFSPADACAATVPRVASCIDLVFEDGRS
jgi:hypothetical protein